MISQEKAIADIERVRRLWQSAGRKRDDIFVPLTESYRVSRRWRRETISEDVIEEVREHFQSRCDARVTAQITRFILELGFQTNAKARSRYRNALGFAVSQNCPPSELTAFIKRHGGIGSCDRKYRAHKRKHSKRTSP